jgi:hypothetical protein
MERAGIKPFALAPMDMTHNWLLKEEGALFLGT